MYHLALSIRFIIAAPPISLQIIIFFNLYRFAQAIHLLQEIIPNQMQFQYYSCGQIIK